MQKEAEIVFSAEHLLKETIYSLVNQTIITGVTRLQESEGRKPAAG